MCVSEQSCIKPPNETMRVIIIINKRVCGSRVNSIAIPAYMKALRLFLWSCGDIEWTEGIHSFIGAPFLAWQI
jgi:hypothetical protein